jgi:pyrroloquinoline quinone biosynthesis protein D
MSLNGESSVAVNFCPAWDRFTVPQPAAGVEASRVGGELVVLDAEGRTLRGLNATAARAWELVDGRRSAGEIAAAVATEFRAGAVEPVLTDLLGFFGAMASRGLLHGGAR